MLNRVKRWLSLKKSMDHVPVSKDPSLFEGSSLVSEKKSVMSQEMACRMKSHDSACNIFSCMKDICFQIESDKIVSDAYSVESAAHVKKRQKRIKKNLQVKE